MTVVVTERPDSVPLKAACSALGLNRSSVYARRRRAGEGAVSRVSRKTAPQPRALPPDERERVHEMLTSPEFSNQPPVEVYQTLLERGAYLCSVSTMHRILREHGENGERRNQRAAQHNAMPRLIAQAPNEVWTWDCSKLATRARSVYLTLYVVLDLFSRFVLAWMVSRKENSALAQQLMAEATARYRIDAGQLTIHQDRGAPMTANRYIDLMSEMGVVLSHSRPRVSNDNAFSEAQFKTQKYQPDYPGRFDHGAHARTWCQTYFNWYNFEHHHAGLAGYTPEQVFTGRFREVAQTKQLALDARFAQHPERFVAGPPTAALPPAHVVINPVTPEQIAAGASTQVNFPTLPRVTAAQAKYALSPN
jgi:putative transposase